MGGGLGNDGWEMTERRSPCISAKGMGMIRVKESGKKHGDNNMKGGWIRCVSCVMDAKRSHGHGHERAGFAAIDRRYSMHEKRVGYGFGTEEHIFFARDDDKSPQLRVGPWMINGPTV